ncbi:phosphoglycolate phosphatase [Vallitalea longa]|uniref:Phosphoglycolate phosphatase n=1 Tax=Vallitalea longa TaxID=2936439 RepID=A0A9W5Y9C0_9FIRM|nr:HAD-IA family hydrolase [Vallitalea longa]GKX29650.1 phosphoglycolate phosphatase [Vallitalea longa]
MYKHIIWDFDGTLFDTYPVMAKAFKKELEQEGIEESMDEILRYMKVSISHTIQHYKEIYDIDDEFIQRYTKQRRITEMELCKPFDGIEEICRYINTTDRNNYLYTHRGESALKFLEKYHMYEYFTDFITSQNGFLRKPSPDAINYLIDKYDIMHDEAIMIGDRDLDILSAKNAGIHTCFLTDGDGTDSIADYTVNNIEKLYSIIE